MGGVGSGRPRLDPVERLEARCEPGPNGCVEWQGSRTKEGYGRMTVDGKVAYLHRFVYALYKGSVKGKVVRHTCDNPPCCNPDHLIAGTHGDNVADRVARGRSGKRGKKAIAL